MDGIGEARKIPIVVHPGLGLRSFTTGEGEVFHRHTATPVSRERYEEELSGLRWGGAQLLVKGRPASSASPTSRESGRFAGGVVPTHHGPYGLDYGGLYINDTELDYAGVDDDGFWVVGEWGFGFHG